MNGGIVALVPVRSLTSGKLRLSGRLSAAARADLVRRMLLGVVESALSVEAITAILVVSLDREVLSICRDIPRVVPVEQPIDRPGLQAALDLGRATAEGFGASGLLVLFGDLPLIEGIDVQNLVRRAVAVVVAPDRHGAGTNALLLRLSAIPSEEQFHFQFGEGSYARHIAEAHRLGLDVATSISAGTSFDLDTPEDLDLLLADPRWGRGALDVDAHPETRLERVS